MDSGLFAILCLCLAVPMATGLSCIVCTGSSVDGVSTDPCADAATGATVGTAVCPAPTTGEESRCKVTTTEAEALSVKTKSVVRSCVSVATTVENKCTDGGSAGIAGVGSTETTVCYCKTDNCNGQTTLAPAIITSLVGLTMALYAVL